MSESAIAEDSAALDEQLLTLDQVMEPDEESEGETTGDEPVTDDVTEAETEEPEPETAEEEPEEAEKDSTPEPEKKDEPWHLKAVMDEREKRQAAQKRIEELEKQLKDLNKSDEKPVSVLEDEEGFTNQLLTKVEQERLNDKLNMSQALAEREFGKDEVAKRLESFKELASKNPELVNRVHSSPLPYHELIDIVDKHEEMARMENIDEWREQERAKLREELKAELEAERKAKDAKHDAITPSLASKRSKGGVKQDTREIGLEDVMPE